MMTDEGKMAAVNVVLVTEVTLSNVMEKEGFERCIQDLAREEITLKKNCHRPPYFHLKFHEKGMW